MSSSPQPERSSRSHVSPQADLTSQSDLTSQLSPLSAAQQRLWFFWQLRPRSSEYNVPKATRLRGPLDLPALAAALTRLTERHSLLRATFPTVDGTPMLRIAPAVTVPLPVTDLTDLPAPARERALGEAVDRLALGPFDLLHGPVFRAGLIRLAAEEHVLVLAFHHIVVDGWSLGIIERDLAGEYTAALDGNPRLPTTPTPTYDYRDYAADERRMLAGPRRAEAMAYWRRQLADAPAQLQLPTDWPQPRVPSNAGDVRSFLLPPQLAQQAQALGRKKRVTKFVVLLSAYAALLARLTAAKEVVIGVPVSGRTSLEVEGVVGLFVNMLPLRVRVRPGLTFAELLPQVRDTFLAGHEYQDLPFQQVVEELAPERQTSRHPIFQSVFTYEDQSGAESGMPGLTASPVPIRIETAKFELTLHVAFDAERAEGWMGYQSDLFEPRTAELLGERYLRLLTAALAAPDAPLDRLPLLGPQEERTVLAGALQPPPPAAECVHRLVARRASEQPTAVAVRTAERALSYAELDRQADLVAARLRAAGARPGALVATCLPRGPELVIAELGVLKSGAAYLPLDPANPPGRLAAVLDEACPLAVLTDRQHPELPDTVRILTLDELLDDADTDTGLGSADARPAPQAGAGDLAYVIYTSGSTGRPKGVMIEHRALANLVAWHHREFAPAPGDRGTLIAAPGFDASAWEIWPTLAAGATLEVPDTATVLSPRELTDWLVEREVSSCFLPTPLVELITAVPWPAERAPRVVLTGGDRLHGLGQQELPFRLVNNYGPTESTVVATSGTVTTDPLQRGALPDIGHPIAGVEAYVLDDRLHPVPIGLPGELYLGGVALARGYLGRSDLTADRFVPHPYGHTPGARLYRTGDLVRRRTDGTLDFLGRNDQQLKLRGFRIEAGEIENVLRAHPGVRDAIVALVPAGPDGAEPALTAYLVLADPAAPPDRAELHERVGRQLPSYMRPHDYRVLPALPLTGNGKVDRAALAGQGLPLPAGAAPEPGIRTPLEQRIGEVWAQALGHREFGTQDNFFDIGGHSLLLATVREALARELDRELSILTLFEHPTIAALARRLDAAAPVAAGAAVAASPTGDAAQRARRGTARLKALRAQSRRPAPTVERTDS
ncbi:amino acid adenylation domain-containing protein [Kitasatospora sp. GAS204B]|uniref:non-ribosomal peptide synthetase n=1 Tax=unclassified Kitasatospora TaxID=2633591 RepID=UPI0024736E80|nr:amino acid adenylation domain-containing protein [Kitasatospora sp. GAS204B]MDH6117663.1 amino acid adenylation domain-containing protein [Kitasatospora sp. GAS204B]